MHQKLIAFVTRFADEFNSDFNHPGLLTDLFDDFVPAILNTPGRPLDREACLQSAQAVLRRR